MERTPCPHEHLVEFYESDAFLVGTVADFAVSALRGWDAVVVVATAAHRDAFADAIRAEGIDLEAAEREGRYHAFDAQELLSTFMADGTLDRVRFAEVAGAVIERAALDGRHVAIYGEMVALLLGGGDIASTIALEDMWNELAAVHSFSLLCAYPLQAFDDGGRRDAFRHICTQHGTVIPAESYSLAATTDQQQRIVAALQQEAAALRAELRRRRQRAAQAAGAELSHSA